MTETIIKPDTLEDIKTILSYLVHEDESFLDYIYERLGQMNVDQFETIPNIPDMISWIEQKELTGHIYYNYLKVKQALGV